MIDVIVLYDEDYDLRHLEKVAASIKAQTYYDMYNDNIHIVGVEYKDSPVTVLNETIINSKADYITFSFGGSYFYPEKFDTQINAIKFQEYGWSFTGFCIEQNHRFSYFAGVDHFSKFIPKNNPISDSYINTFPNSNFINKSSIICDRKIFDKIGLFDERLMVTYDYDMWLRMCYCIEPILIPYALVLTPSHIGKHGDYKEQRGKEIQLMQSKVNKYMIGEFK